MKTTKTNEPEEIQSVLKEVRPFFRFAYGNTKVKYFNVPVAFDIETTSFFRSTGKDTEKCAITYGWTFGIFGRVILGRTWEQFCTMLDFIIDELQLNINKRLICYIHNMNYEFQFMRKYFIWEKVFSISSRTPIYGVTTSGIEFRCSYLLSGYSLEKLAENLQTIEIKKLVGDLDYTLIRHTKTPLTEKEKEYMINDVKIVMAYIAELIDRCGDIVKIPLTKTGFVRNYCRNSCFYEPGKRRKESFKRVRYMDIMKSLRLTADEYKQLKRAFQGGFTHSNPFFSGKVMYDVTSYDFTSSYPAVMIAEQFPMSSGEVIKITSRKEFEESLKYYCCVFDIEFVGLESRLTQDSYISVSRCWNVRNATLNNGRVFRADSLMTTITEQDYMIIKKFYKWKKKRIGTFRRYKKGYLPTDFVKSILKLYGDKTKLKGVEGKEVEYLNSKEMLNSCFGMSIMDVIRKEYVYTDRWLEDDEIGEVNIEEKIKKYNNNKGRFLFYPWGVWVTAYARRNLFTGIVEFGTDYIYSDTDSLKVRNAEKHQNYIEKYNKTIYEQLKKACAFHKIDPADIEPETIKGDKKRLGVWDFDGSYSRFKTLGAKRYMVEYSDDPRNGKDAGKINITVSGLNKKVCVPYLCKGWAFDLKTRKENFSPFNRFAADLYVPPEYTGKMTHTYIDEPITGTVVDYLGVPGEYNELSFIHLAPSDYSLSIAREYADFLAGLENEN